MVNIEHLTTEVCWTILAIVGLLLVASLAIFFLRRRVSERASTELAQRIKTWWGIFGLMAGALLIGPRAIPWLFALVSFLAMREFLALVSPRPADTAAHFWAYLSIPMQYLWVSLQWYGMFIIFVPVYVSLLVPARLAIHGETQGFVRATASINWGALLTVFGLSHAAYLVGLTPVANPRVASAWLGAEAATYPGIGLLVLLLLLTELNDVAQFIWGKSLGYRKVAPKVSPGKTWAGLLGGVGTTIVLATLLGPLLTPMNYLFSALAGAIIGIFGSLGDLCISALKRDANVKDTGNLLPGHGGILDRIDSLTFTAPLFFHFVHYCWF
ncbi:MAG: phosphatidate cytidylyltransferase [Pirellulales bacterium]|nr:phosphatidate cytidylyltransferase [Pirellulales bacterium]